MRIKPKRIIGSGPKRPAPPKEYTINPLLRKKLREAEASGSLGFEFVAPPFNVLDGRAKWWQNRKRLWFALGVPRSANSVRELGNRLSCYGTDRQRIRSSPVWSGMGYGSVENKKEVVISAFDPVACELMLRWFCPHKGNVLDPFCGGPTLGAVASLLGYSFLGIDIDAEQVKANNDWAKAMKPKPKYVAGDALDVLGAKYENRFDLILTDPPYYSLEKYSGHKNDGAEAKRKDQFKDWLAKRLRMAASALKVNRFFIVKIGDVRDSTGGLFDLAGLVSGIMQGIGFCLWNKIVYITPVGTLPIRVGHQFRLNRKLGATYQFLLVFYRGNPGRIPSIIKPIKEMEAKYGGYNDR